jgi:hypothetical protein
MTKKYYAHQDLSYIQDPYDDGDTEVGGVWFVLVMVIILITEMLTFIPRKISRLLAKIRQK